MNHCFMITWLVYGQAFESKDEDWRQKYDYKNLKDLGYKLHKSKQPDKSKEPDELKQPDHKLPPWIKSKNKLNELKG